MRLGWDEYKRRAKAFSEKHADKKDERADSQLFLNDFFKIFDMSSRQIGRYEALENPLERESIRQNKRVAKKSART